MSESYPKTPFGDWSPDKKKRVAYLEGREDLFDTKVFRIPGEQSGEGKSLAVFSRDPGSAAVLIPVIKELSRAGAAEVTVVADGRAEEMFRQTLNIEEASLPDGPLSIDKVIARPDVILTDTSASNRGLELYAATTYQEVPIVLLEDYYGTANNFLDLINKAENEGDDVRASVPARICVMDQAAKDIIQNKFPELAERIIITGTPAFDRFAEVDRKAERESVRAELTLSEKDFLVTFIGVPDQVADLKIMMSEFKAFADKLGELQQTLRFVFRKHPRDNISEEEYAQIIAEAKVESVLVPERVDTHAVVWASDVVCTNWSTVGLEAATQQIPVLYVNDVNIRSMPPGLSSPLPPVELGASAGVYKVSEIAEMLETLADSNGDAVQRLKEGMKEHYHVDGNNAKRVSSVVQELL